MVKDPSWKSGPPEPDHLCHEHTRPTEVEGRFDEFIYVEPVTCDAPISKHDTCPREGEAVYTAEPSEFEGCPATGDYHIEEPVDLVGVAFESEYVWKHKCAECGEEFEARYTHDKTTLD